MRRLRSDQRAVENLIGVFVFLAVFIGASTLFIQLTQETIALGDNAGNFVVYSGRQIIQGVEYVMFDPDYGHNLTEDSVRSEYDGGAPEAVYFENAEVNDDTVQLQLIRNNTNHWSPLQPMPLVISEEEKYDDFLIFETSWGWWSQDKYAIPLVQIMVGQERGTNTSTFSFMLHNTNYTAIVTTPGPADYFEVYIELNIFNVRLAVSVESLDNMVSASMWAVLGQLMTARLPNVDPVVNVIVALIFWPAAAFTGVMIFRSFVPLLG